MSTFLHPREIICGDLHAIVSGAHALIGCRRGPLPMMLLLISHIPDDVGHRAFAKSQRAVTILPAKIARCPGLMVHVMRARASKMLYAVSNGELGRDRSGEMDVIL